MRQQALKILGLAIRISACWKAYCTRALPVNTIRPIPIVDLTPGSISIAADRLVAKRPGQPSPKHRRPEGSNCRPHSTGQGPHRFRVPKAFWANAKTILRTEPVETSRSGSGAQEGRQARCRADGGELSLS